MEIIEGTVSNYKGHGDIHRFYGKIGEEIKYYFLDFSPLSNGNMIATTELVEAIDSEVPASHIGLVDNDGNVIIPLENKTVKPITGDILLVERSNPLSQNVLDAIEASKDTKLATGLVSVTNTCKNKVMEKLGVSSELIFHNQLSEASIFDINGNNLVNDEYFSYIGVNADKVYLGKNLVDAPITEYSMLPPEIQSNTIVPDNAPAEENINVETAVASGEEIKEAVDGEMAAQEEQQNVEVPVEEPVPTEEAPVEEAPVEDTAPTEEVPVGETPVEESTPTEETPTEETPVEESTPTEEVPVEEAPVENAEPINNNEGFNDIDLPDVPVIGDPGVVTFGLENTNSLSPEEVANATADVTREETPEEASVNIINDENQDNVDDVLNSLFGNIPAPVEEPAPTEDVSVEETPVEAPVQEEVPAEEPVQEEPAPVEEETPAEEEVPVEEPAPVEEEVPAEEPAPIEEPVTTEEPTPAEEEVPVEEPVQEEPAEVEIPEPPISIPIEEEVHEEAPVEEENKEDSSFSDLFGVDSNEEDNSMDSNSIDDDIFSNFSADKIETSNEFEFNDYDYTDTYEENTNYNVMDDYNSSRDDILSNAGKVMSSLITLNRKQKSDINRLNNDLSKANNNSRAKSEKIDLLENKLNSASNKVRNLDSMINKLESKNTVLTSKVDDQKRLIESQTRELNSKEREIEELRRQLQGKEELAKFIADAQNLLGQNDY